MRIGEISELTGLSVSNIRFYEKKGLIEPAREAESKYREYTEADLMRLKQITLYRKMNFSIDTISMLIQEKLTLEQAVVNQLQELEKQKEMLEGSISLCQKVLENREFKESDLDYYLNYVREEEAVGTRFAELDEFLDEFADFAQITRFIGDPYVGKIFLKPIVFRGFTVFVLILFTIAPFILLLEGYLEKGTVSTRTVLFWIMWELGLIGSFIHYKRQKNREG